MGYYTSYSLSICGNVGDIEKFNNDLLEISKDSNGEYDSEVKQLVEFGSVYAKLYDLEGWIREVAKKNPRVLVILSGNGEESFDVWQERYKGKLYERQEMIFPPFETPELQISTNND